MAGITTARGLALLNPGPERARSGTCFYPVRLGCDHLSGAEMSLFLQKRPLSYAVRVSVSIAEFGPHCPGMGRRLFQVFGDEQVSSVDRGSDMRAIFRTGS